MTEAIVVARRAHRSRTILILLASALLVVAGTMWSLAVGAVTVPVPTIVNTLFALPGDQQPYIILRSRLPRTLMALLAGGALGLSGAIIQAVIRNPLASPNIIGISAGAALATLGLILFLPQVSQVWIPFAASLGGVLAAGFVIVVAHRRQLSPIHLALVGVAVSFVFEAAVDYLLVITTDHETSSAMMWLTGSLVGRTWDHVAASAGPLVGLGLVALLLAFRLDLVALGDDAATGLGLDVPRHRILLLLLATLLASIAVGFVGVMGFVGLMAPHIARHLVGGSHKVMLPLSMLVGMVLVVLADAIGRAVAPPIEISAGIVTALIGAPFFIYIMLTTKAEQDP